MTEPNGIPAEVGQMMRATARNLDSLQAAVVNLQAAATEAKADAETAKEAATEAKSEVKRWKFLTKILVAFMAIALAVSVLSVYNWAQNANATDQLRKQAITSCQIGNERAAGTVDAFNEFFKIAEGPHPTPKTVALVKNLEAYILAHNPQRNCNQAYNARAAQ